MTHDPLYRDFVIRQRQNGDLLVMHALCDFSLSSPGSTLAHLVELAENHIDTCNELVNELTPRMPS